MCNVSRNVYENGRVEGLLEGTDKQNKKVVKNMYEAHLPIEIIQIATKLSLNTIHEMLVSMNLVE